MMQAPCNIPCLYFSFAANGVIIEANTMLCNELGYAEVELLGKKVESIFTLPARIFNQTHLYPLLQMKGVAEEIYITLLTKSGAHLPVLVNADRSDAPGGPVFRFAGIAVRHRNRYEEEIIAAKKAAEKALNENTALLQAKQELQQHAEQLDQQMQLAGKRNEELILFNHVVTHDLQEPLRKLSIFTSMILDATDAQVQQATVKKLSRVAEDMRLILGGLQQYIWITNNTLVFTKVSLYALLKSVEKQVRNEYPDLFIRLESVDLPEVEACTEQLQFLLYEIFKNAIRFRKRDEDVVLTIDASRLMLNRFRQLSDKYKYTEFLKLQIRDNGMGIEEEYSEQAFELFRRLHPASGRGIGLSLCRKIVENHNGTITLNSKKDQGALITIMLPLKQEHIVAPQDSTAVPNENYPVYEP